MSFILMPFIFCSQVLFSFRERWPQLRVSNSLNFPKRFQNLGTKLKLHSFALHILCLKGLETSLLGRFIYICSFIIFFLTFLFDFQKINSNKIRNFWSNLSRFGSLAAKRFLIPVFFKLLYLKFSYLRYFKCKNIM